MPQISLQTTERHHSYQLYFSTVVHGGNIADFGSTSQMMSSVIGQLTDCEKGCYIVFFHLCHIIRNTAFQLLKLTYQSYGVFGLVGYFQLPSLMCTHVGSVQTAIIPIETTFSTVQSYGNANVGLLHSSPRSIEAGTELALSKT